MMATARVFSSEAKWLNCGEGVTGGMEGPLPAPIFRREFTLGEVKHAVLRLCGLGYHDVYVNGRKVGDSVLAPSATQFERRVTYIDYDVTAYLQPGANAIAVLLGNGHFNVSVDTAWLFNYAPWRELPKLCAELTVDGGVALVTDRSWKCTGSWVTYNVLFCGETIDNRLLAPGFSNAGFDDSGWKNAAICGAASGGLYPADEPPCRVMRRYKPVKVFMRSKLCPVYDFGTNLTGWCSIRVSGPAGATLSVDYSEKVLDDWQIAREFLSQHVHAKRFQHDVFILKGEGVEEFRPHFVYHGFRYVRIWISEPVEIQDIQAEFVHTAFDSSLSFDCSDDSLNRLQEITRHTYLCNFTGIPTDCPHREKNGWTGDAALACETGLWNFDCKSGYEHFVRMLMDAQRPNGQIPCIAPDSGWGISQNCGPAWDAALIEIPWQVLRFYGDDSLAREAYPAMTRYVEYCRQRSEDNCVGYGLGDWCPGDAEMPPCEFTSTCCHYGNVKHLAYFAERFGEVEAALEYQCLAMDIRRSFNEHFYKGSGVYSNGGLTAQSAPLYFGLVEDSEKTACLKVLVDRVRQENHTAQFGILGAKYVLRVLAENGYMEDAYKMLVQPEMPGWGYWLKVGATTLWETWSGGCSENHIMFGDVSAWMAEWLGGVHPQMDAPGFRQVVLQPMVVPQLGHLSLEYKTPLGVLAVRWKRTTDGVVYQAELPEGCTAVLRLPDGTEEMVTGTIERVINL